MIKDVKNLRSLFFINDSDVQDFTEVFTEVFKASRSIRLLYIGSPYREKKYEAIKNLRHLRYLNLDVYLTRMPRSLSSLYHLQFIIYKKAAGRSCSDDFLPGDVSNLSNLRHVELSPNAFSRVPGIGRLRSLEELNELNVKNENGYRIGELEHMDELRKLKIHFLENVKDAGEAHTAKLFEKRKLTELFLNWGNTFDDVWEPHRRVGSRRNIINSDLDVKVLENLKPYKNLKSLSIFSYEGVSSAKWMYNADLISNLEYISLNGCSEWETLPPFGQLPHLKSLYLCNMPKVKQLDNKFSGNNSICVFPALEVLHMEGLQVLEDLFDKAGAAADDCFFPCLTELFLFNCPNLQELHYLPPKLKKMKIQNIRWKAALNCKQETNNSCLETLEVLSCPNITSLLQTNVRLEALRNLKIEGCPNLISLGGLQQVDSGIEKFQLILSEVVLDNPSLLPTVSIASLEKLTICNNDALVSFPIETEQWFPHVSSSLRELSFRGLTSMQCLPSFLERLSSLKILRVEKVPQLQQLLHIPASLEALDLKFLESLQCLPSSLSAISSLKYLCLDSIPLLKSLPELPPFLYSLSLCSLDNLQCLPSSLSAISSLKHLYLNSIPLLKSLPELPPSLNSLTLWSLDNLECLPSSLSAISSLEDLRLISVPLFKSLPDLPSSLESLAISDCHPELRERYKIFSGADWHKIAHIPRVSIDYNWLCIPNQSLPINM